MFDKIDIIMIISLIIGIILFTSKFCFVQYEYYLNLASIVFLGMFIGYFIGMKLL